MRAIEGLDRGAGYRITAALNFILHYRVFKIGAIGEKVHGPFKTGMNIIGNIETEFGGFGGAARGHHQGHPVAAICQHGRIDADQRQGITLKESTVDCACGKVKRTCPLPHFDIGIGGENFKADFPTLRQHTTAACNHRSRARQGVVGGNGNDTLSDRVHHGLFVYKQKGCNATAENLQFQRLDGVFIQKGPGDKSLVGEGKGHLTIRGR